MRHKRHGRVLGRSPSHRKAMLRNLASALILTEREDTEFDLNAPKVRGRITTTLAKAKEVRPLVEKCVTIAKKGLIAQREAEEFGTDAERNTEAWKQWRQSDDYAKWLESNAPSVNARRRLFKMLRNKEAVAILCDDIAERFEERPGGYTRIMRLATPRLGDAGTRAILEFVGKHDRVVARSEKPEFGETDDDSEEVPPVGVADETESDDVAPGVETAQATEDASSSAEAESEEKAEVSTAEDASEDESKPQNDQKE